MEVLQTPWVSIIRIKIRDPLNLWRSRQKKKKLSNKYVTIFFGSLENKDNKRLNISFSVKKKIGNAVCRNKIKRRLRSIMNDAVKKISIKMNYSYLVIPKQNIINSEFKNIKETLFQEFENIK